MTPTVPEAWLVDVTRLVSHGEFGAAMSALQAATLAHPASAAAWKLLGVAENKLGEHADAERHLQHSLELDDSDADAWSSLGGICVASGRHEDALRCFEKSLACSGPNSYALLNYLTMVALVGDADSALRRLAPALRTGRLDCQAQIAAASNLPWCHYDLAQILFFDDSGPFQPVLAQALATSAPWQAASARRTYELLTHNLRFGAAARQALEMFTQHSAPKAGEVA